MRISSWFAVLLVAGTATLADASSRLMAPGASLSDGARLAYLDGPTWYAIAGSFRSRAAAETRARQLGGNWYAQQSDICDNYTPGLWLVAAGFNSKLAAERYASGVSGYAKECR